MTATELATLDPLLEALVPLQAEAELAEATTDSAEMSWLPDFFLGKQADIQAARERIKEHAQLLQNALNATERALHWHWGKEFQAQVNHDLTGQAGKKKSVTYLNGLAGYRTTGGKATVVVDDEQEALAAAEVYCPGAIKRKLSKKAMLEFAEQGEALAGTHVEETEKQERFYPSANFPELETIDTPKLEGESNDDGTNKTE